MTGSGRQRRQSAATPIVKHSASSAATLTSAPTVGARAKPHGSASVAGRASSRSMSRVT